MTRSNRLANRLVLALLGLIALAVAAVLALPLAPAWGLDIGIALTAPDTTVPAVLWAVVGAAVIVVLAALAWIVTRGRGRTSAALRTDGVEIDTAAVQSVLRRALGASPDIAAVSASAHRHAGEPVVLVRVQASRGPDLPALTTAVRAALQRLDEVLGTSLPVVVHLTSGMRSTLTPRKTTH
jgi:hypothetical protein